ncbi:hypothetical protein PGB90_003949 [Kerria lacca]
MNCMIKNFLITNILSKNNLSSSIRQLYGRASIGLEDYEKNRQKFTLPNNFREKMIINTQDNNNNRIIFSEDLKLIIHVAQSEDLILVENMMKKFNKQNQYLRFGSYNFGPVVMRMYHYLNRPEEALKIYYDEQLEGFFDQLSSVIILMDLLYENKKYSDIIELYKTFRNKQLSFGKYPKSIMVLIFASCYKLNTAEIFDYAMNIWKEMNDIGLKPLRRITCYIAALALNQNSPHIAIELITTISNHHSVLIRSLKVLAYCAMGRIQDALPILTSVLTYDVPNAVKQIFPQDVIESVKNSIEKYGDRMVKLDFIRIEKQLKEQGYIKNESLDDLLSSEIIIASAINKPRSILKAAFNNDEKNGIRYKTLLRPGLSEIV